MSPRARAPMSARGRAAAARRGRVRLVGFAVVALVIAVAIGSKHKGGSAAHPNPPYARPSARAGQARLTVGSAQTGRLVEPLQDGALAAVGPERAILAGGLTQSEVSVADIFSLSGSGVSRIGSLPTALHDASAAYVNGAAYVFGGGQLSSFSQITRIDSSGAVQPAGRLPTPASDVASATIGSTVYVVGGYTGQSPLRTILAWRPGGGARVAGTLPKPLRYAAVAALDGQLLIAGGTSGETASTDVYRFDPSSGAVSTIGQLPAPLTHAAAVSVGSNVLVLGGRGASQGTQRRQILAVSLSGQARVVGTLPEPLSDVSAVALDGRVIVAGGRDKAGRLHDSILTLTVTGV